MRADMQAKAEELRNADPEKRPDMLESMQAQWQALEDAERELAEEEKTGSAAVRLLSLIHI